MKYLKLSYVILGLVMSSATCTVLAALPEPLDPREVSSMNFEQRLAHGRMIREEMNKATPDERKAYRDKMHQKMQAIVFSLSNSVERAEFLGLEANVWFRLFDNGQVRQQGCLSCRHACRGR